MNIVNVKNRSTKDVEFSFDGQVFKVPAGETVPMVEAAAMHGIRKSKIWIDPETNESLKALVLATSPEASETVPGREEDSELLKRRGKYSKVKFSNTDLKSSRVDSPLED